jgi:hypothetical protein
MKASTFADRAQAKKEKREAVASPALLSKDDVSNSAQTLKLLPQPQVDLTFGLMNLKPAPCRPST